MDADNKDQAAAVPAAVLNPSDAGKHARALHIAALITGNKEAVSDEEKDLKSTHAEILSKKEVDLSDEEGVVISVYLTLGGNPADVIVPEKPAGKESDGPADVAPAGTGTAAPADQESSS